MKTFKVGDKVAMARAWVRSTQNYEAGHLRGTVASVGDLPVRQGGPVVILVQWNDRRKGDLARVLSSNLVNVEYMHLEVV